MKETKIYICEVCGTQYASKTRCMACEKSHKKPLRIKNCKYLPKQNSEKGYPFRIDVKMEDGEVISYKLWERFYRSLFWALFMKANILHTNSKSQRHKERKIIMQEKNKKNQQRRIAWCWDDKKEKTRLKTLVKQTVGELEKIEEEIEKL